MKPHPKIIDRILEGIGRSRTLCVAGHIRPDGDCIGSQLGLALALEGRSNSGTHAGGKCPVLNQCSPITVFRSGRRDDGEPVQKFLCHDIGGIGVHVEGHGLTQRRVQHLFDPFCIRLERGAQFRRHDQWYADGGRHLQSNHRRN